MRREYKEINIKSMVEQYKKGMSKFFPNFVFKKLHKLLYIDEFNRFNKEIENKDVYEFLVNVLSYLQIEYKTINSDKEHILSSSANSPIFISNHPLGAAEALCTLKEILPFYDNALLVSRKYMKLVQDLAPGILDVGDKKEFLRCLKDNIPFLIYPAGKTSKYFKIDGKMELRDLEWQHSIVKFAIRYNRPIVVIHTEGKNYDKFYNVVKWRKRFGIKATIEGLYLVEAMFKCKEQEPLTITFGQTIDPSTFTKDIDTKEWTNRLMQYSYELKEDPNKVFDPTKANSMPIFTN